MTISDQIIQVLDALCEKFGLAIDWTSENVIPYLMTLATKLVSYEIWTSVAFLVIMLVSFTTMCMMIKKYAAKLLEIEDVLCIPIGVFSVVGGTALIGGIIQQIMDIIKCLTFPELFIFEYIQNLINTAH